MKKIVICIIGIIVGLVLAFTIKVGASISSTGVMYNNTTTVKDAIDNLYKKTNNYLEEKVSVGDYIFMTPTSTSFTTDTYMTGYTNNETINPSELNLWRVIRINDNGTIEVVSEYVSNVDITFKGQTGYQNIIGYLNVIASQYTNIKYVQNTRNIGYNGQTEYITDTSKLISTIPPWTSITGSITVESLGGGDYSYVNDTNLIKNALGTLTATKKGTTSNTKYWVSSRWYNYASESLWFFCICYIDINGNVSTDYNDLLAYRTYFDTFERSLPIRPILTLKSGLKATGSGTSSDPFVLS